MYCCVICGGWNSGNEFYKPESMEAEWHPLFAEALQNESKISFLVDILMFGTDEEILDFSRTEGRR